MEFTSEITVREIKQSGNDAFVVAAAKVSTDMDEALQWALEEHADDAAGLINYLMKHRHGSPFEHGQLTVFADVPIFVWREWHRHRVWSFNEQSARYGPLRPKFWIPRIDRPMIKVEKYKAARPKFITWDEFFNEEVPIVSKTTHEAWTNDMKESYRKAWVTYEEMLNANLAPEVARAVLPVATYSAGWATVNPRNCMAFLSLRTHEPEAQFVSYPQAEIEEAARQVEQIFAKHWPICYNAFNVNGRVAP